MRAGEAKLCRHVREECLSTLGLRMVGNAPPPVVVGVFVVLLLFPWFVLILSYTSLLLVCFFVDFVFLMLCATVSLWVFAARPPLVALCFFLFFCVFAAMRIVFFMVLAGKPPLAAICVGFLFFVCF